MRRGIKLFLSCASCLLYLGRDSTMSAAQVLILAINLSKLVHFGIVNVVVKD